MMLRKIYKVAEHYFSIGMDAGSFLWTMAEESYGPFEVTDASPDELAFSLNLVDGLAPESLSLVYSNKDDHEPGYIGINVYGTEDGGHYFEFVQPMSEVVNGRMLIDKDLRNARVALSGSRMHQWLTFNVAADFIFLLSTSSSGTVLTHSSAVVYEGRAYLFLGKSGTGKSTHSRMWLESFDNVLLLNDDHPVIRLDKDGKAVAYGSPWSGKTHCYRNMSAPLGGIVRIVRAPHNRARRLGPVEAYASLMTSCSGMTWDEAQAHGRDRTMQGIISCTPCWTMECLPEHLAASVCMEAVTAPYREGCK